MNVPATNGACRTGIRLFLGLTVLSAPIAGQAAELSRERVIALATAHSAAVRSATARLEAARRTVGWAPLSPNRVEIDVEAGPRIGLDGSVSPDGGIAVSRALELGSKAERREDVAVAELRTAEAELAEARTRARIEALSVWAEWVGTAERARALEDTERLAEQILRLVERRAGGGAATRFDVNTARLSLARARLESSAAARQGDSLAAELALLTGLAELPSAPTLNPLPDLPPLEAVLERATATRGVVKAARAAIEAARARVRLARAEGTGDIALGGFASYEEENVIAGILLRWELPLGTRAEREADVREAEVTAAEAEVEVAAVDLKRQLTRAWHLARASQSRAERLRTEVDPLFEETTALVRVAIDRGGATLVELQAMLRERRELSLSRVDSEADARNAATLVIAAMGEE